MGCDADINVKSLIVDCEGCPSLAIEVSETTVSTSVPLSCAQQDMSIETLIAKLLNTAGDAIKTTTI